MSGFIGRVPFGLIPRVKQRGGYGGHRHRGIYNFLKTVGGIGNFKDVAGKASALGLKGVLCI